MKKKIYQFKMNKTGSILDFIDDFIERKRIKSGNYPTSLVLSQPIVDKIKAELDSYGGELNQCWAETFPTNYRGIPIEIKEKDELTL